LQVREPDSGDSLGQGGNERQKAIIMIMIIIQIGMLTKSPNKIPFPSIKSSFSMLDFWTYVFGAISFIFYTLIRVKAK
jgi:hypothetical protein